MPSKRFKDAFKRLAEAEQRFLENSFLAPVAAGGSVRVRIAGVPYRLRIEPESFRGWGVFKPTSTETAELVRPAGLVERQAYLRLFPKVELILSRHRTGDGWWAVAAHFGDTRMKIEGLVPVLMVEEAAQFEIVRARFDGLHFWFEGAEPAGDPAAARYLRQSLLQRVPIEDLDRPGLTPEQKAAYAVHFIERPQRDAKKRPGRPRELEAVDEGPADRIREALGHAGAALQDFIEANDGYRITYQLGGRRYSTSVQKDDLTVQVAGICLSGQDRHFDLHSLVGVVREAEETGEIYRIGDDGMDEEQYWNIHPPQS
ncbi:MAG: hypothetical protein AAF333_00150 [Planctomycetota bacterium]